MQKNRVFEPGLLEDLILCVALKILSVVLTMDRVLWPKPRILGEQITYGNCEWRTSSIEQQTYSMHIILLMEHGVLCQDEALLQYALCSDCSVLRLLYPYSTTTTASTVLGVLNRFTTALLPGRPRNFFQLFLKNVWKSFENRLKNNLKYVQMISKFFSDNILYWNCTVFQNHLKRFKTIFFIWDNF